MIVVIALFAAALAMLAASAFFSASETGFLSVSRERVLHLAREGGRKARIIQTAIEDMGKTTTAILIGNNISNVSYSAATAALSVRLFGENALAESIWSFLTAFTVLYMSEFLPKLLCSARPLRRMLLLADAFWVVSRILSPLTWVAMRLTDIFMPERESKYLLTSSDLLRILQDRKDGVKLSDIESALIGRIFVLRAKGERVTPAELMSVLSRENEFHANDNNTKGEKDE